MLSQICFIAFTATVGVALYVCTVPFSVLVYFEMYVYVAHMSIFMQCRVLARNGFLGGSWYVKGKCAYRERSQASPPGIRYCASIQTHLFVMQWMAGKNFSMPMCLNCDGKHYWVEAPPLPPVGVNPAVGQVMVRTYRPGLCVVLV